MNIPPAVLQVAMRYCVDRVIFSPYFRHFLLATTFYRRLLLKQKRALKRAFPFSVLEASSGVHFVAIKKPKIKKTKKEKKTMIKQKQHEVLPKENKKNLSNFGLAQLSKRVIDATLKDRVPAIQQSFHLDDDPNVISQVDLFSGVDQINAVGTKLYRFQNKSRNMAYEDLCIECIAYKGRTYSPVTGTDEVPISGGFYYKKERLWLVPNLKELEVLSMYLPRANFVGIFSRFILDILFSDHEIWKNASGIQPIGVDRYCVFFKYSIFVEAYLRCVIRVTTGNDVNLKEFCKQLVLQGNAVDNADVQPKRDDNTWEKQDYQREQTFF